MPTQVVLRIILDRNSTHTTTIFKSSQSIILISQRLVWLGWDSGPFQ